MLPLRISPSGPIVNVEDYLPPAPPGVAIAEVWEVHRTSALTVPQDTGMPGVMYVEIPIPRTAAQMARADRTAFLASVAAQLQEVPNPASYPVAPGLTLTLQQSTPWTNVQLPPLPTGVDFNWWQTWNITRLIRPGFNAPAFNVGANFIGIYVQNFASTSESIRCARGTLVVQELVATDASLFHSS